MSLFSLTVDIDVNFSSLVCMLLVIKDFDIGLSLVETTGVLCSSESLEEWSNRNPIDFVGCLGVITGEETESLSLGSSEALVELFNKSPR